ncbi:glycosyltransferase family 4 protein [Elizabethkingia anophelis]|uniref:glycosyltransferase family 4 protein n=1 Tax=Elizabethkingia anophelis TaxID=1117645 RepID=UPI0020B3AE17|nr:glycosyltransferase family 4 protein [Elizabethkingia anophelis]UTF94124.1 glycosyltransferase family 4 protein [Elizabethkingia anophelis]
MRKCFLVSYNGLSNSGGVEKVCNYLFEIINDKCFEIVLIDSEVINNTPYGKFYKMLFNKIHIIAFTFFSSLYIAIKRKKGDIKIAHGFNSPFFKTDFLFIHGTMRGYAEGIGINNTNLGSKLLIWLERTATRNADVILSVSQNAIDEVRKYYTKTISKYFIVNNGVDDKVFYPIEKGNKEEKIVILFCGRLDYGKGVYDILQLAKNIENKNKYKLSIACNNSNNIELFNGLNNTSIHVGLTTDKMNEFYNSGDIMYFPSKYEGFEMVTLEALSAGVPVIGNDIGAISELVKHNDPGVSLINTEDIFTQIDNICNKYKSEKIFLHEYYKSHYGIELYKDKILKIIS